MVPAIWLRAEMPWMRSAPAANITLLAFTMATASMPSFRPSSSMASMVMSALTCVEPRSMATTPFTAPSAMPAMVPFSWLRAEIFMMRPFGWRRCVRLGFSGPRSFAARS